MILPAAQIVAVTTEREFFPVAVDYYPGGEPMIKDVAGGKTLAALIVRPGDMESLLAALFFIDVSEDRGYPPMDLILPYFPGGRQDRVNTEGDLLFTARSVARLINNTNNINTVKILDPHSDVIPALLDRVEIYHASFVWGPNHDWSGLDYDGVIAPDAGAVKRATKMAELLRPTRSRPFEILQGWKHRDIETGGITGFGLQPPRKAGGHFLVVDDICDGGGTFLGLAREFNKYLMTADLFVTHGIFSSPGNTYMLKKSYGSIYCSDSILISMDIRADGISVIPVVERML